MTGNLIYEMIQINGHDTKRINHALKVYGISKCIALLEGLGEKELMTVEYAAVLHDIGIHYCEQAFGRCTGKMQEQYGPHIAKEILLKYDIDKDIIQRVEYLISHHHTYTDIDGLDYQILIEADFLVNYDEGDFSENAFLSAYEKYFKTKTGRKLAKKMFDIPSL